VVRHAGRAAGGRTQSPLRSTGAAHGAAAVAAPGEGAPTDARADDDPRLTSGLRLTPVFTHLAHRRVSHDVPAFGTPEHSALLSGSLDLDAIERAAQGPLVGFAPIVLDPRGPSAADLVEPGPAGAGPVEEPTPPTSATRILPTRRSLRASAGVGDVAHGSSSVPGQPLSTGVLPGSLPSPRPVSPVSGPLPEFGRPGPTTGPLRRVQEVEQALAACPATLANDDPTPTGELARPFVDTAATTTWPDLADVPPPVSVDVFQRAVRAGLAPDDPESLKALDDDQSEGVLGASRRGARSRRELRARERAAASTRSVTARRLAKGSILAITALGVVSGATPQGLNVFGLGKDGSRNTIDFASAVTPERSAPMLTTAQLAEVRGAAPAGHLQLEPPGAQPADAVSAGIGVGGAMAQLAHERDGQVLADQEAQRRQALRGVIADPQGFARMLAADRGWGAAQFRCLVSLWDKESHWNYRAANPSSGAYGIAQALPGLKMNVVGPDWRTNPVTQIKWGLNYIADRYGTPCGAWGHSQATGWY
jgi:Transglycosylase SLT domain